VSADPGQRTGATALRDLDWSAVLDGPHMPFLGSMLDDLATGLDARVLPDDIPTAPRTRLKDAPAALRNI
jgi:hypothetical protein